MKLLFSAIAWSSGQEVEITAILRQYGFGGIEAAPSMFGAPLCSLSGEDIANVRTFWTNAGLPPLAMQGLLFGRQDLKLFGDKDERRKLAVYLEKIFEVAGQLGCAPLVFGSPRNRQKGNLTEQDAMEQAAEFFAGLAPKAADAGCTLCIEANASAYNCDFITQHEAAAKLVSMVNAAGFGLQVDTGVMRMNGEKAEDLAAIFRKYDIIPTHVHISQPWLACDYTADAFHRQMAAMLGEAGYKGNLSVEMKNTGSLADIRKAAQCVQAVYGADCE